MGTQAKIFVHQGNNLFSYTDIYHDGYLSYTGVHLYNYYSEPEMAKIIGEYSEIFGFNDTGFIHHDDEPSDRMHFYWNDELLNDYDFIYIYVYNTDNKWYYRKGKELILLKEKLIETALLTEDFE